MPTALKRARGAALVASNLSPLVSRHYHGTDKLEHGYLRHYRRHLGPIRFRQLTMFEIGVGGQELLSPGGSLQLWRDYLRRATVVGIDIHPKAFDLGPRVHFVQADQSRPDDLRRAVLRHGAPDVVIDDGSHVGAHVITSFRTLWPELRPGGMYVIEDLATSFVPAYGGDNPPPADTGIGLIHTLIGDVARRDPALSGSFDGQPALGALAPSDVAALHSYPGIVFIEKALEPAD